MPNSTAAYLRALHRIRRSGQTPMLGYSTLMFIATYSDCSYGQHVGQQHPFALDVHRIFDTYVTCGGDDVSARRAIAAVMRALANTLAYDVVPMEWDYAQP